MVSDPTPGAPAPGVQATLEGMPTRLFQATPTRLTTWLDCPRRYRYTYLDRPRPPKGPPWAHNSMGGAVHNALAEWFRRPLEERTPGRAARLVEEYWKTDGFRDRDQSDTWRARAVDMVRRYVTGLDPAVEPRGLERTVALTYGGAALSGRIDRLDERPMPDDADATELIVVDYKTGRHLLTTDDARSSLALALYAAAAERTLRRRCRRVELHHLPSGEVITWEHTDMSVQRHLDRADDIARECAAADAAWRDGRRSDADFPARPGPLCGWCDFAAVCPEGSATTARRPSWAGLDTT